MDVLLLPEIAINILFFLNTREIYQNQLVCKDWYIAMHGSYMQHGTFFWKQICALQCLRHPDHGITSHPPVFCFQDNSLEKEISLQQWKSLAKQLFCYYNLPRKALKLKSSNILTGFVSEDEDDESLEILSDQEEEDIENIDEEQDEDNHTLQSNTVSQQTATNSISSATRFDASHFSETDSVILRSVWASTVDHKSQDVNQTRYGLSGYLSSLEHSFWSSEGSKSTNSNDCCIYLLKSPSDYFGSSTEDAYVLVIDQLKLQAFMASWQNDSIYPSEKVSISIGLRYEDTTDEEQEQICDFDLFTSEEFVFKKEYTYQSFPIGPILLFGRSNQMPQKPIENNQHKEPKYRFEESKNRKLEKLDRLQNQNRQDDEEEHLVMNHRDILYDAFSRFGDRITPELRRYVTTRMRQRLNRLRMEKALRQKLGSFQVRLNLIGKNQQQPEDNLYYTCLEFVDITGSCFEI